MGTLKRNRGGGGARKYRRLVKREKYLKNFEKRYGMTRKEWVEWKKNHTAEEIIKKREEARERVGK